MPDYDVIVIGCGPAGQQAAIKCAKLGRRVALVDDREVVGGMCLHVGTIPSKTLREAIIYLSGYNERKIYGPDYRVKRDITIEDLLFRCNEIIRREIEVIHNHLDSQGVEVLVGRASFTDPHTINVASSERTLSLSASGFIICTGSAAHRPEGVDFDGRTIMTTDEILDLLFLPQKLVIVGGGVIAIEYACMFGLLDIDVTVVSSYRDILPFVDRELVAALKNHMQRSNVKLALGKEIAKMRRDSSGRVVGQFSDGEGFEADLVLFAASRRGNTAGLNLQAAGVPVGERGHLKVDECFRTEAYHILAAGDVIGFPALASTSGEQGRKAANHLLGISDVPYQAIFPYGIYTIPEISMAGESEDSLQKKGVKYEVGIGNYLDTARGQIVFDEDGLVKLLFDPETRKLYGVHIIGTNATELIHIGQAVLIYQGTLNYFIDTVFNYPTLAEAYKLAAINGRDKLGYGSPAPAVK